MSIAAICTCGKHPYYCGLDCPHADAIDMNKTFTTMSDNKQTSDKGEDEFIQKHLDIIKSKTLLYRVTYLLDRQREECLKSIMNSDFYRLHQFDFPKSYIITAPHPEELNKWEADLQSALTSKTAELEEAKGREQKWISVEDKQPELFQNVAFIVDSNIKYYNCKVLGGKYQGFNYGLHEFSTPGHSWCGKFWLPLPKAPQL